MSNKNYKTRIFWDSNAKKWVCHILHAVTNKLFELGTGDTSEMALNNACYNFMKVQLISSF